MKLETLINSLPFDFFFLVVDPQLDIKLPGLKNFYPVFDPDLKIKNSGFLLSSDKTQTFIRNTTAKSGHRAAIVPFKPSAKISLLCQKNNWIEVSSPPSLNRLFEDKIKFPRLITEHKLPQIPYLIGPYEPKLLSQAGKEFGFPLVAQTHFGWAGKSTFLVSDISSQVIAPQTLTKLSPYKNGYSLLNNCCLTRQGLLQSPPALQYTGLKPFTTSPFTTVGRQWPSLAPQSIQSQVEKITADFSKILNLHHYRGFFGLDFLVSDSQVFLLECNPRLTASFAFYTAIEEKNNLNPLFYFHLLEFTAPELIPDLINEYRFNNQSIIGSEITLKNQSGQTTKKYHDFVAFSASLDPPVIDPSVSQKLSYGQN